jgi:hypothetical protein
MVLWHTALMMNEYVHAFSQSIHSQSIKIRSRINYEYDQHTIPKIKR